MKEDQDKKKNFVERMAGFIVDKRNGFFLMYIGLIIFSLVSTNWVSVNNDLTSYLPEETETRQGLTLMEDEFTTFATADVMIDNISYKKAEEICEQLEDIEGVKSVEFDETEEHFKNASALFSVTFDGESGEKESEDALNRIKDKLGGWDLYITSDAADTQSKDLDEEMKVVMLIAVVIIVAVLLLTSKTYGEIPVLLMTFGTAAILNKGTNYLLGEISFISNSVAVVLQLALAIDYAIILCHRFLEERVYMQPREAAITALSKAIPEISGSCLTTISGLGAMMFMHFKIGFDMGLVLIKAIMLSIICVFTLMPGLLMLFSKIIDKTSHKNFVPNITPIGKLAIKTRFVIPPLFAVLIVAAFIFSNKCPYVYGYTTLETAKQNTTQIAEEKIDETFGTTNMMALIVPSGDYKKEAEMLEAIEKMDGVDYTQGLANTEAVDGYMVTDELTTRQFAELTDMDIEVIRLLYGAYAANNEDYGKIVNGIDEYGVPLIDMFMYLYDQKEAGYVTLDDEMNDEIEDMHTQLMDGKAQLESDKYSRMLVFSTLPEESPETFEFLGKVHQVAKRYYPEGVYLVGNSTNEKDLSSSFVDDNVMISVLSAIFVIIVLIFTFKSAGLPVLLILVIQGSVWINFSFPYLTGNNMFFLSYLVVSSIQMGANIDYAIVITSRYQELKKQMPIKEAVIKSLNQAFPTIVTSGTILAAAGILIGRISSDPAIASIGSSLGRGTIISIVLVMLVLPQILVLGDFIIEKTAFTLKKKNSIQSGSGTMRVNGRVRGYVSGVIDADIKGVLHGNINAMVEAGVVENVPTELLEDKKKHDDEDKKEDKTEDKQKGEEETEDE